jgi:putative ABC transport system permease protein
LIHGKGRESVASIARVHALEIERGLSLLLEVIARARGRHRDDDEGQRNDNSYTHIRIIPVHFANRTRDSASKAETVISVLSDLRYTARELRKRPGFAITAVLSLALGIGATTAVFSVIYAVVVNPFPYQGSDRMMEMRVTDKAGGYRWVGADGAQIQQIRQLKSFEDVIAEDGWNLTTTDSDLPEDVQACYLGGNMSQHFGIPAILGRTLLPSDAPYGQEPQRVVVLGYAFWQRYYSGDPKVVGRNLQLIHKNYQIVGVMPPRFRWREADIYVPQKVTSDPAIQFGLDLKLRPGVTVAQANGELDPVLHEFARLNPAHFPEKFQTHLRSIIELYASNFRPVLYMLLGAVALLLLIGCANVSILLLARGTQRQHELAVRSAIGANRVRLIRQMLTESLALAIVGTGLGILIAWKGLALLVLWLPNGSFPAEAVIRVNIPVLLFSVGLAFVTSIFFGLSPALHLSRPDIAALMQSGARRVSGSTHGRRTHATLVAAQVALTLVLLTGAGAASKGFLRLMHADLGYDPHNTMSVPIPVHNGAHVPWKDRSEYFEKLRARIASMPEVIATGISTNATPPSNGNDTPAEIKGSTVAEKPQVRLNFISPEYFEVLRIPLRQGRLFDHVETMRGAPIAVINETMAKLCWPKGDAVGHEVRFVNLKNEPPYSPAAPGSDGWLQIVGIVADARDDGLRKPVKAGVYVPYALQLREFTQILVRTRTAPLAILRDVRRQLIQVDPDQQAMQVRDLDAWITNMREWSQQRLVATLFGIFSTLALVLAAVGLYSVVSYGVATRTNEIGIRMALGARRTDVLRIVFSATAVTVGIGVTMGALLSVALDKVTAKWVTETAHDPLVLTGGVALLFLASTLACILPARRATSVAPMEALRYE